MKTSRSPVGAGLAVGGVVAVEVGLARELTPLGLDPYAFSGRLALKNANTSATARARSERSLADRRACFRG
jgi:hypothetical protein